MTGLSLVYNWIQNDWLFVSILSLNLGVMALVAPLVLGLIQHKLDQTLNHFSDNIFDYYCAFFFFQNDPPKYIYSKIMMFMFSFSVLVFMTFYIGILTEEFSSYKNFEGISVAEDLIDRKAHRKYGNGKEVGQRESDLCAIEWRLPLESSRKLSKRNLKLDDGECSPMVACERKKMMFWEV